jgi:hypothetical protein
MRAKPGPPMTLANMRQNGVRMVTASCEACGREADVNAARCPRPLQSPRRRAVSGAAAAATSASWLGRHGIQGRDVNPGFLLTIKNKPIISNSRKRNYQGTAHVSYPKN